MRDEDKTIDVEILSAVAFATMGVVLLTQNIIVSNYKQSFVWEFILVLFATLQVVGLCIRNYFKYLRICMSWVSGTTWTWIALISLNSISAIPTLFVGIANLYAFVLLTNNCNFDWCTFFKEK